MSEIFWHYKCGCARHKTTGDYSSITHLEAADPRVPAEVVLQPARAPAPGHEPLLGGGGVGAALQPGLGPHADRQLALARHVQLLSCVGAAQLGLGAHCAHHGGKLRPGTWNLAGECTAQYSTVRGRAVLHSTALAAWRVSPVMLYCTTLTYPDTEILCGDHAEL